MRRLDRRRPSERSAFGGCAITAGAWIVICVYAAALAVACLLCAAARSKTFEAVALVMAAGWLASIAWYLAASEEGLTWGYAVITYLQCAEFGRLSRGRVFPLPLFVIHAAALLLYLAATVSALDSWWTSFLTNRLFEAALLYIMTCAILRIRKARRRPGTSPRDRAAFEFAR